MALIAKRWDQLCSQNLHQQGRTAAGENFSEPRAPVPVVRQNYMPQRSPWALVRVHLGGCMTAGHCRQFGHGGHSLCQPDHCRERTVLPVAFSSRKRFWKHPSPSTQWSCACCCWSELCTVKWSTRCLCCVHPGQPAAPSTLQTCSALWQMGFLMPNLVLLPNRHSRWHRASQRRQFGWPGCTYFILRAHWSPAMPGPLVEHGVF